MEPKEPKIIELWLETPAGESILDMQLAACQMALKHKTNVHFMHNDTKYTISHNSLLACITLTKSAKKVA